MATTKRVGLISVWNSCNNWKLIISVGLCLPPSGLGLLPLFLFFLVREGAKMNEEMAARRQLSRRVVSRSHTRRNYRRPERLSAHNDQPFITTGQHKAVTMAGSLRVTKDIPRLLSIFSTPKSPPLTAIGHRRPMNETFRPSASIVRWKVRATRCGRFISIFGRVHSDNG
jgi:hypothetical protein